MGEIIDFIPEQWATPIGLFFLALLSWWREWWVTGKTYRRAIAEARVNLEEMREDRDFWREKALDLIGLAEEATDIAEEAVT